MLMKRILLLSVILAAMLLSACAAPVTTPTPAPTPAPVKAAEEWYVGGTLHKATVSEWHRATYTNRLATCADWVVTINSEAKRDLSTLKLKAIEVEKCVTEATKDISEIQHHQVTEYALACINLMGYNK